MLRRNRDLAYVQSNHVWLGCTKTRSPGISTVVYWRPPDVHIFHTDCNILMYISSINTWASGNSPLAQLVKELDLYLYLCVIRKLIHPYQN